MRVGLSGSGVVALVGLGLLAALGIWVYWKGPAFLKTTVTQTLNPASDQNIVNQGVTGVVSAATGREESLGGMIADQVFAWTHPDFSFTAPVNLANPVAPPSSMDPEAINAPPQALSFRAPLPARLDPNLDYYSKANPPPPASTDPRRYVIL